MRVIFPKCPILMYLHFQSLVNVNLDLMVYGKRVVTNETLNDLAVKLRILGRHPMLSYLSSLPIAVLRSLDTEANRFYDRNHQLYNAALLTRCYTQHALRPFIDSESNHIRKVQVGKDQEKAQSEKDFHSKNRGGKKKTTNNQVLIT